MKATKRGWRQRNKNGSGAPEQELPEAVINTTPGKVVPPRYRFQNNLNQSLKVRLGEESKLNSSAAFNMTQLSEAELLKPHNSLNSGQAENGNYNDQLPNLPTSNREIHQIFSPMNIRKKKNLQYSRETAPRKTIITGIDGVGAGPAKGESRNLQQQNLMPLESSRELDKMRLTQSNQRRLRIIRPHDTSKGATLDADSA